MGRLNMLLSVYLTVVSYRLVFFCACARHTIRKCHAVGHSIPSNCSIVYIDSLLQLSFIQSKTHPEFQTSGTYFTKEHKQCLVLFQEKMNKV